MSRLFFGIILLLLIRQFADSQSLTSSPLKVKSSTAQTYSYANESRLVYFVRDNITLHVLVYDTALILIKTMDFELEDFIHRSEGVIAIAEIDKKPTLFFGDKKLKSFSSVALDLNSYQIEQSSFPEINQEEYFLNSFAANNRLYLLWLNKKSPFDMIIREVRPNHPIIDHAIPLVDLKVAKVDDFTNLFLTDLSSEFNWEDGAKGSKLKRIRWDEPNNNISGSSDAKFYGTDSSIIIILDAHYDSTYVITINLISFQKTFRKMNIEMPTLKGGEGFISNSFLFDKKLFHVATSGERILLSIQDFESGNLLKQYTTNVKEPISYMSGNFVAAGSDGIEDKVRWDTKKFLKEISLSSSSYTLGVGAFVNDDNELELTVGNTAVIKYNYYPFLLQPYYFCNPTFQGTFFNAPGAHPPFGGFRILLPALLWSEGSSTPVSASDNYYFRAFFNKSDLTPIHHSNEESANRKLNLTVKRIGDTNSTVAMNTMQFKHRTLIAYFNSDTKQFVVAPYNTLAEK